MIIPNKINNTSVSGDSLDTASMNGASLTAGSVNTLDININQAILQVINAAIMNISSAITGGTITANQIFISGALNCNDVTANTVVAGNVRATTCDTNTAVIDQLNCNTIATSDLTVGSLRVSGSYESTGPVFLTGPASSFIVGNLPANRNVPIMVNNYLSNGSIDNSSAYALVSNTSTLLSDMMITQQPTGPSGASTPLAIFKGLAQSTVESLPQIVSYNYQLAPSGVFDLFTGYGGQTSYLSLDASLDDAYRTLRFQEDGLLAIYYDATTLLWESTNLLSDARLKNDIKKIENSTESLKALNPVYFKFKDKSISDVEQAGFIAQEVEPYIPESVVKRDKQNYLLHMEKIVPYLIEGIKTFPL